MDGDCTRDQLEMNLTSTDHHVVYRLCGRQPIEPMYSTSNVAHITFCSDFEEEEAGFSMTWHAEPEQRKMVQDSQRGKFRMIDMLFQLTIHLW